ncbi:MAG: TonB-dependent receptor plug domain-containing protein [Opitutaceae bacterium]|nr:TonB-dependent receptor plug domain-containing protein [Opitutaceae bacterium]
MNAKILLPGALLSALLSFGSLGAQTARPAVTAGTPTAASDEPLELSVFTVTGREDAGYFSKNTLLGTRTNERLVNIPQNIQIINRELLDDLAKDNYLDALQFGASGINKRTPLVSDVNIRGFRVITGSIMRDGIPNATSANVNGPTYDIERIEVVKGPAALLFGQAAATGGLINFVTKRPSDTQRSSVTATAASFNLYRLVAETSGPLAKVGAKYRVTVAATEADGQGRFDYTSDRYVGLGLDYQLSAIATLNFDYYYYDISNNVSQIGVDSTGQIMKVADDFTFFEPWVKHDHFYHFAILTAKATFSPTLQGQLVLSGTWGKFDRDRVFARGAADAVTGVQNRTFQAFDQTNNFGNLIGDLVKTWATGSVAHKTTLGIFVAGQKSTQDLDSVLIGPINIYNPVYNTPYPTFTRGVQVPGSPAPNRRREIGQQESGYLQHQATFWDGRVILVGGYRYNRFHSTTTQYLAPTGVSTLDRSAAVYRWGAIFKPAPAWSIYYNYSESFVYNSGSFVGGDKDGQPLLPSYGVNNEVGVKAETSNGRLFGSVAVFDLSLTNVRTLYTQPSGVSGVRQDGEETNKGYEADIGLSFPTPAGPLQTILTYYKGDQKNAAGALPNGVTNDMWSVFVAQTVSKGPLKGLRLGAGSVHKGPIPWGLATGAAAAWTAASYTTTDAFVTYSRDRYRLAVNVDNVADKRFSEGGGDSTWVHLNPGRTFKFTCTYRF